VCANYMRGTLSLDESCDKKVEGLPFET
jgi:hypothetical protein